jgi:anhydro-N-acetylmuramic acid kinase
MALYVGLISGTSMDAIDAALVEIDKSRVQLKHFLETPYATPLREKLERVVQEGVATLNDFGSLHTEVGLAFAEATLALLRKSNTAAESITAIGSHGQTVVHSIDTSPAFTLQLGNPSAIARRTGIVTVADFRAKDVAAGGQGAPLVPGFHEQVFRNEGRDVAVVNIGGISNATLLGRKVGDALLGFDCGPGNTLMDLWTRRHLGVALDVDGRWAASGRIHAGLLESMLSDPYLVRNPPKSTGRELFNLAWLDAHLGTLPYRLATEDVQATLAQFTVAAIVSSIDRYLPECAEMLICGGGARNRELMRLLTVAADSKYPVRSTDEAGVPSDAVEACTFAWLAERRLRRRPGNIASVTGAEAPVILGGIYDPD